MAVVSTGFFDGVHLGHRLVLSRLVEEARRRGTSSCVVTFWPHPRTVLQQEARSFRLLSTLEEKRRMILSLGVDRVEVVPFTRKFSSLSTREYLSEYLIGCFGAEAILLGYDNRMGRNSSGPDEIEKEARSLGLEVIRSSSVEDSGKAISSTRIREALLGGDVALASEMLGYDYTLEGVVVAGNHLGRTLGFPTANLQLREPLKLVPGNGAYLVGVETLGQEFYGMCNIGVKPTVSSGESRTIETNIFSFDEDIYGLDLKLTFRRFIREERKFSGKEELVLQLQKDRRTCLEMLNSLY